MANAGEMRTILQTTRGGIRAGSWLVNSPKVKAMYHGGRGFTQCQGDGSRLLHRDLGSSRPDVNSTPPRDLHFRLILGSASPRRQEIVRQLGLSFVVIPPDVDESRWPGEGAEEYLRRITRSKWEACCESAQFVTESEPGTASDVILVADTIVVVDGMILGKPKDRAEGEGMLRALSGREHEVSTRFALGRRSAGGAIFHEETVTSSVSFRPLEDAEIRWYAATGEGTDKAGGYAIQGAGAFAVRQIVGSYSNIVGLPACELVLALRACGYGSLFAR